LGIWDIDLGKVNSFNELVDCFENTGFQAGELSRAVRVIEEMKKQECTVFFSFTANLVASGLRGVFAKLCEKKFVDAVITTAGSIDHDVMKTFAGYEKTGFGVDDIGLHEKGMNRIGNIAIPNRHFELFEKKTQKWLEEMHAGEKIVSPSDIANFFGKKLDKTSFLYWCSENNIPVFCPGITDGAIGLQMYFFKQKHKNFNVSVTEDMDKLAQIVLCAQKTGAIILGGGISKHHVIGTNLARGGLDYSVYISTATEFDGSLSGAKTNEAKSWGKIKEKARTANVYCEATIAFPLIIKALQEKKLL
jgi:deoxyhypusine synthase